VKNIVIIGMPGAGKSTMGVILAKALGRPFIDTDLVIQEKTGMLLQEILDRQGTDAFTRIEQKAVLSLRAKNAVVATGGSVVFSRRAMEHLKKSGVIIYLEISFEEMEKRLQNITTRGIVLHEGESLREMYNWRAPLYQKYADITVACTDAAFEDCVEEVIRVLGSRFAIRPGAEIP